MCGIVAVINKYTNGFNQVQINAFESLLYIDGLRGLDSTGVIYVNNRGDFTTLKGAVTAPNFLGHPMWENLGKEAYKEGSALIGHNRKATKGVVSDLNAHPFVVNDELALVHNGTMFGDHRKYANVEVDSHAITHLLHDKGVEDSIKELQAAYTLFWYDQRNKSVNLLRNTQRPLWWLETADAYYYASEKAFLEFIIQRHALKVTSKGIFEQPEYSHSYFILKDKSWEVSSFQHKVPTFTVANNRVTDYYSKYKDYTYPKLVESPEDLPIAANTTIITPASNEEYEKKLISLNKLYTDSNKAVNYFSKDRNGETVYGMLLGYKEVNSKDPSLGLYLYFTEVNPNELDPYLLKLRVAKGYKTHNELDDMIKQGDIFQLTLGGAKSMCKFMQDFSSITLNCLSGRHLPNYSEMETVNV